jgi:hypothetical protein
MPKRRETDPGNINIYRVGMEQALDKRNREEEPLSDAVRPMQA